ncbi:MAG: hypothetical protein H0Z33_04910 [Bacillaceae bacterium]|nr:hypothetical protein [Bacillaceae bacterium]
MNHNILLATGDEELDNWLNDILTPVGQVVKTVYIRTHIVPQCQKNQVDVLIISDNLPGDIPLQSPERRDREMIEIIEELRLQSEPIRIIYLCRRREEDIFLKHLIQRGIWDIFWNGFFQPEELIRLLKNPPAFKHVVELLRQGYNEDLNLTGVPSRTEIKDKKQAKKVEFVSFPPKFIVIGNLSPSSGTTFITVNLARFLGEKNLPVSVYEPVMEQNILFDYLGGAEKSPKDWVPWALQIQSEEKIKEGTDWEQSGVKWVPAGNQPLKRTWTERDSLKLTRQVKQTPLVLVDLSNEWDKPVHEHLLMEADMVWLITDTDPLKKTDAISRLQPVYDRLDQKLSFIVNRWFDEADKSMITEWAEIWNREKNEPVKIPVISLIPELGHENNLALWKGKMAWDYPGLKEKLKEAFIPLSKQILPQSIVDQFIDKGPVNLFQAIFRKVR